MRKTKYIRTSQGRHSGVTKIMGGKGGKREREDGFLNKKVNREGQKKVYCFEHNVPKVHVAEIRSKKRG